MSTDIQQASSIVVTGEATGFLPVNGGKTRPITVIGTDAIRATFDDLCIRQAINSRMAPGVSDLILNPDAHCGYGAPVGCVLTSPTHVYPGPVASISSARCRCCRWTCRRARLKIARSGVL